MYHLDSYVLLLQGRWHILFSEMNVYLFLSKGKEIHMFFQEALGYFCEAQPLEKLCSIQPFSPALNQDHIAVLT